MNEKEAEHKAPKKEKSGLRENIEAVVIAVILALVIRAFVVQPFKIPSGSMIPTLLVGDHIFVNKFIFGIRMPFSNHVIVPVKRPARGDIVVFKYPVDPTTDFIKRVVAVEGDVMEMRERKLYINGRPMPDPHGSFTEIRDENLSREKLDRFGPIAVPPGKFFVMGDNRDHSLDSRFWGFVDFDAVLGRAFIIYWSWNSEDRGVRWNRIGKALD
ncbi:MAG: signal peptidase I [Pseudomonadota bacterium]